jgi:hypothetical protein
MPNALFKPQMTLGLLAGGLGLLGQHAWADIRVTQVETDGRVRDVSAESSQSSAPMRISSTVRTVRIHFAEADTNGNPTARLRYKLEGHDETWQDLPIKFRAIIYFRDLEGKVVGSSEFYLEGETPGWRGMIETSDFVARRESATAPARSALARISFLSHGGDTGMGLLGVDAVRLLVERATGESHKVYDLNITGGTDLAHPLGTPDNWSRRFARGTGHLAAPIRAQTAPRPGHPGR